MVAFSPAGTHVAFVGGNLSGQKHVYVRDLGQLDAVVVRGSDNALSCFFSPAGDAVGFITDLGVYKVSLRDLRVTLLAHDASNRSGGSWGPDGRVTFARDSGLWQVPAEGGAATQVTTLTAGESLHAWPAVVNDGKAILFTSVPSSGVQSAHLEAVEVDTGKRQVLIKSARFPRHASSGHLVFYRDGGLHGAPFDGDSLTVTGPPIEVIAAVEQDSLGRSDRRDFDRGLTRLRRAGVASGPLVWVSRQGIEQHGPMFRAPILARTCQPTTVASLSASGATSGSRTRSVDVHAPDAEQSETASYPVWTPDGKQVVFRTPTGLRRSKPMNGVQTIAETTSAISPAQSHRTAQHWRRRDDAEGLVDIYVLSLAGDSARVRSSRVRPSRVARSFLQMAAGWPTCRTSPVSSRCTPSLSESRGPLDSLNGRRNLSTLESHWQRAVLSKRVRRRWRSPSRRRRRDAGDAARHLRAALCVRKARSP